MVPFAGLHQSEGNSLATFLSVTGGAFLSNWSRAPSQLEREKKEEELSAPPRQGEGERDGEEYVKIKDIEPGVPDLDYLNVMALCKTFGGASLLLYFVGFLISQP